MKTLSNILLAVLLLAFSTIALAQNKDDAKALVKQGISLHDAGKYDEAISKYKEALKIDPDNYQACYEISFTLYASGKSADAMPYLEKAISSESPYRADAYDLLGNIYDDDHQPDKAIENYLEGIRIAPDYQRLYFNVAITYYRKGMFAEAEKYAINAIKLDPKHASSQRIYAMATYKLQKRGCSLLGWCSFLLLEPGSKRSPEAYNYIHNIINYGIKQTGAKSVTITISDSDLGSGNLLMPMAVSTALDSSLTGGRKSFTGPDSLALQLTSLFKISTAIVGDKESPFVVNYFGKFFEKLGNSDNMPAFARFISMSAYNDENVQWLKDNDAKLTALDDWIADTKREVQ